MTCGRADRADIYLTNILLILYVLPLLICACVLKINPSPLRVPLVMKTIRSTYAGLPPGGNSKGQQIFKVNLFKVI